MKTLEIKHLAAYLPYGLKMKLENFPIGDGIRTLELDCGHDFHYYFENGFVKPLLLPLSELLKEIEYKGEKFIPIVELLRIHQTDEKYGLTAKYDIIKMWKGIGLEGEYFAIRFSYEASNDMIVIQDLMYDTMFNRFTLRQKSPTEKQQWLQYDVLENKLLEWHFDKFKLIDAGLALNKNNFK